MAKELNLGTPNKKQELFFLSRKKYVGYGGARGGGKSWAIRSKAILLAYNYPGITITILRKTFKDLDTNHIIPLNKILYGFATYNDKRSIFNFPNGSSIRMRHCDHESDLRKLQGQESDVIFIEECTQFTFEQMVFIMSTCRGIGPYPRRMYYTGNPGGVGHNWFKRLFVKGQYEEGEEPEEYEFIPATVDDNTVLKEADPDYVKKLDMLPSKLRQAHRYGDWDIYDGQYFEEFRDIETGYENRKDTHVIAPFEIPGTWRIYRSFDWGYSKPFACQWWAVDFEGRAYNILEYYGCTAEPNTGVKLEANEVFKEIKRIEVEHRWLKGKKIYGVADPSIWAADRGESIAETAEKYRVYFDKGDNARLAGWMQLHYRLAFDERGIPMMYIFNTCKGMIRTLPTLMYDKKKVEDLDTDGEDHLADSTRYFCMMNAVAPRKNIAKKDRIVSPLDDDIVYNNYDFFKKY